VKAERVIIVGGPRRGKSTLARELAAPVNRADRSELIGGCPIYCGDPLSKVKDPQPGVRYLPEGIPISGDDGAAQWVADNWFTLPGPWVCEGWVMARALRRWLATYDRRYRENKPGPADRIIVLDRPAFTQELKGQASMHKAVMTVWAGIAHHFPDAEYL
jgi:hypothetical protein